jgi:hypothetical protein
MTKDRTEHLELIAASLANSYYQVHTGGSPEHRDIFETYKYFLDALVEQDGLEPGQTPLLSGDTLAPFVPEQEPAR